MTTPKWPDPSLRLVAFTGKGGVGKTTCSAAAAVAYATKGERTLLLTTDRSPSLSDIFELDVSGEPTPHPEVDGLDILEMDYEMIVERWKDAYGEEVYHLFSSFLDVDREVIDYVAEAPGIPEEYVMGILLDFYEDDQYDRIVWDTAPAGSTLSLLELQKRFYSHLGQAPSIYADIRSAMRREAGERPSKLLEQWRKLAKDTLEMVQAPDATFVVVTIPEGLAVEETRRIIDELTKHEVDIGAIVVNNVLEEEATADSSFHEDRSAMQQTYLEEIDERWGDDPGVILVPQLASEVKGLDAIRQITRELMDLDEHEAPELGA